ncbi:NAD(P)H azoreductase [Fulvia fulva]|uniref:NAD(P)H azoreductase n=1 Tax=Passalora fulva TaxID=5499 RepID=A0A9Q8P4I9_PASFU|nr:NAD(P)H azoreductase [Fulvia fulva]KAK4632276.1 NAD(P)H azoreductase [Fulvia fulva]KAK4632806.1 NAD(P)H azoreductase [Fulvia fulva]UJO13110.1 NAD(P)H azoreductase [Fulvia fulva]WPV11412.1 NAD(P)H azoreductase [Fulvia fulva]WPV25709.1 NAD(P)H azoreductase [Fulvia fulva]
MNCQKADNLPLLYLSDSTSWLQYLSSAHQAGWAPTSSELLDAHHEHEGITVRLATSRAEVAEQWRQEGRQAVILDLDKPQTLPAALDGVERVFMVTGYTAAMLYQGKIFIDAAEPAGVKFVVHLGVYSSGNDAIPHYVWHDMVETYIKASKLAWTNLHPNVILDSVLVTEPSTIEQRSFNVMWGEAALGWVSAADIGTVAASRRPGEARWRRLQP